MARELLRYGIPELLLLACISRASSSLRRCGTLPMCIGFIRVFRFSMSCAHELCLVWRGMYKSLLIRQPSDSGAHPSNAGLVHPVRDELGLPVLLPPPAPRPRHSACSHQHLRRVEVASPGNLISVTLTIWNQRAASADAGRACPGNCHAGNWLQPVCCTHQLAAAGRRGRR